LVDVIKYFVGLGLRMLSLDVIMNPSNDMVLERSLDELV
jgi:hypothetical protein